MRAEVVADDRDAYVRRAEGAQVAAELQEPGPGLARLDVPIQLVFAQLVGGEQVPDPAGAVVAGPDPAPRRTAWLFALAADRGPLPSGPGLQVERSEFVELCRARHNWTYADTATMPMCWLCVLVLEGDRASRGPA